MRDLLPGEMRAFRRVEDAFRQAAGRWGYEEIRTPTIETYSLFTAAGGLTPAMLSRVYSFLDWDGWSGERVVLRPDSTIPVARAATEAGLELPARLCYVQNVFRFSERDDREDWQCGLEYLDAPQEVGDLEVIAVGCETLDALGFFERVRLGHAGITRAVAEALAEGHGEPIDEVSARLAAEGLAALRPTNGTVARIGAFVEVALQQGSGTALIANLEALAAAGLPAALPALAETRRIAAALSASGRKVVIDFGIPRDFDYYSGVVFEFESGAAIVGRGGRYTPGGEATPGTACGLALDVNQLIAELGPRTRRPVTVAVVPASDADFARAVDVAQSLHRSGIPASLAGQSDAALLVRVDGARLMAKTPDGDREIAALDELVGLLVQDK